MDVRLYRQTDSGRYESSENSVPRSSELISVPYQAFTANTKQPIFLYQPLPKVVRQSRPTKPAPAIGVRAPSHASVRASSYATVSAGKAPKIGGTPLKGNGPVKLQASRRLPSGELMITSHALAEINQIKEGNCVGGQERLLSTKQANLGRRTHGGNAIERSRAIKTSTEIISRTISVHSAPQIAPIRKLSPTKARRFSTQSTPASFSQSKDTEIKEPSTVDDDMSICEDHRRQSKTEMVRSYTPSIYDRSTLHTPVPPRAPLSEQTTITETLWAAEYSQLIPTYDQEEADYSTACLESEYSDRPISITPLNSRTHSTALRDSLLKSPSRASSELSERSDASQGSSVIESSSSMSSSRRPSATPSRASSATTQTSLNDEDDLQSQDNIKKMINQIKNTYLTANELQKRESKKVKRRETSRTNTMTSESSSSVDRTFASTSPQKSPTVSHFHADEVENCCYEVSRHRPDEPWNLTASSIRKHLAPSIISERDLTDYDI